MEIVLRYGRTGRKVILPDANVRHVLRSRSLPPIHDPEAAIYQALRTPVGCPPLRELAVGRREACIVTSDITRPVPNTHIIPALLCELEAGGVPPDRVTILIGTGLHRANTFDELKEMLGEDTLASGARIVNHNARESKDQVAVGRTSRNTRAVVNRAYREADLRITISLVEPHLMAGFSGGRKAICPGICGIDTIRGFHGPQLLDADEACAGVLQGNPVNEEALAVALLAGRPHLTVNVTLDENRQISGLFAGELLQCHLAAVRRSVEQSKVTLPEPVDIVITSNAGYPLDLTFYQGIKGMVAAMPIVKRGGTIIIAHECAEGIGGPEFTQLMLSVDDPHAYIASTWDESVFCIDQWQLHEQVKVLRHVGEIFNFSEGIPADQQAQCFVTPVASVEEGVEMALAKHGSRASIGVIPEGPYVLACVEGDLIDRQP